MNDGIDTAEPQNDGAELTDRNFGQAAEPFGLFSEWLEEAGRSEPNDPSAMTLATVDDSGLPDARMVLLKGFSPEGFVFYTNLESQKGRQLASHPKAALCFHWKSLRRQVRVRGDVEAVTPAEADDYFRTRPRLAQIGAWASRQSAPLESRLALEKAVARETAKHGLGAVPRPPHWSGFRVKPQEIEFWRDGAFRLHHRVRFTRGATGGWTKVTLFP